MLNNHKWLLALTALLFCLVSGCSEKTTPIQKQIEVVMFHVTPDGIGHSAGKVVIHPIDGEGRPGIHLQPALHGLPPGEHGFHMHEKPSCEPAENNGEMVAALAAGGHYDPKDTEHHEGPLGHGHLGDLPRLKVDASGNALDAVVAPRLKFSELKGHSLVVHKGSDTYSDHPPMGGGGARIACGVIN